MALPPQKKYHKAPAVETPLKYFYLHIEFKKNSLR